MDRRGAWSLTVRLALLAALLVSCPLAAQEALALHPGVTWVASGGAWQVGRARGHHRLIIIGGDPERTGPRMVIEWIEEDASHHLTIRARQVIHSIEAPWALSLPTFVASTSGTRATIPATNTRTGRQATWIVTLGPPGVYSVSPQR